jgi:vacuolar-type H+-ATPase subunit E/Vma4
MDKTTLESSIKQAAEETIAGILENEAQEIKRLDEITRTEIESFRKQRQTETDAQILQELARLDNKMILESRKLNLLGVEDFINCLTDEVMTGIREHPRYPQFLLNAAINAAKDIPGHAEVRLATEDLFREKDIQTAVKAAGRHNHLAIKGDPSIRWGGCLIIDEEGGRIFNNTLERIYFRKSLLIRQRVMKILADQEAGKPAPDL